MGFFILGKQKMHVISASFVKSGKSKMDFLSEARTTMYDYIAETCFSSLLIFTGS